MFNHIFIIHREIDIERKLNVLYLIKSLSDLTTNPIEVVEPEPIQDDYKSLICFWNKKEENRKAVISLYNTNIKLYERIIENKLDKVLILEDDAELIDEAIELDQDCLIHFLNTRTWLDRNVSCLSNYYPHHYNTRILLHVLKKYREKKKDKHRPIDLELDYAKNLFLLDFKYSNFFKHSTLFKSSLGNIQKLDSEGNYTTIIQKPKKNKKPILIQNNLL